MEKYDPDNPPKGVRGVDWFVINVEEREVSFHGNLDALGGLGPQSEHPPNKNDTISLSGLRCVHGQKEKHKENVEEHQDDS